MEKGKIFFIMGVSGAGKGTLIKNLQKSGEEFSFPLSCKSRPKRDFEVDMVDARFFSEEEFKKKIDNNEFWEYAFVHGGGYYGTLKDDVFKNGIDAGKNVLKEVDILGLRLILEKYPEHKKNITTIFLNISDIQIENRLRARGEELTPEYLESRINSAQDERGDLSIYDFVIDSEKHNEKEVLAIVLDIIKK